MANKQLLYSSSTSFTFYSIFFKLIRCISGLILLTAILSGGDAYSQNVSFGETGLQGESLVDPTSLCFGPNNKLYVTQQDGTIWELTVERNEAAPGSGEYTVTQQIAITTIKNNVPNRNDDGSLNSTKTRQITGIMAAGTAENPILYVSSSDWRIGGGGTLGNDTNLDTNSGVLSRLTWNGQIWEKVDLVRGLPRCEENHSTNGMEIFNRNGTDYLLIQQGGNTNMGAPSNNFAGATETFLSGALLIVNLTQLEAMETSNGGPYQDPRTGGTAYVYDLPTLNDPEKEDITNTHPSFPYPSGHPMYNATIDLGDPFGGNNGLNQAFTEVGGPVEIFSPGFRNAYDVVVTQQGRIYTSDNGPNIPWGGPPVIYDAQGVEKGDDSYQTYNPELGDYVTNQFNLTNGITHGDQLHYIGTINDPNGTYYGGHPTPVRAFPEKAGIIKYAYSDGEWVNLGSYDLGDLLQGTSGYFQSSFSLSDFPDDPRQGKYTTDDISDPDLRILDIVESSTNGICEYTASNFNGAMQGDLLTASYNGNINRYKLDASGTEVVFQNNTFFGGFGSRPLDVIALGDEGPFPGTVWAVTYGAENVTIFEPNDFSTCLLPGDPGYDGTLDYDMDGFTNSDEIDNGTDPCSAGSKPDDFDEDSISDLNDPDDDNDGIPDLEDVFAIDPLNGLGTELPLHLPFWNNDPGTGFFGLGFTGIMLDPGFTTNYLDQFDDSNMSFGGAAGKATIDNVGEGDALGSKNDQDYGFQLGIAVDKNSEPFTVQSSIETPFNQSPPGSGQEYGIFIGTGDQDSYLKLALSDGVSSADEIYGFRVLLEDQGGVTFTQEYDVNGVLEANTINLYISVNPASNSANLYYSLNGGLTIGALGTEIILPDSFLDEADDRGLAVGIISTTGGDGGYSATWDFITVNQDQPGVLAPAPVSLNFGEVQTGSPDNSLSLELSNLGGATDPQITVTELNLGGPDSGLFTVNANIPLVISPGETKIIPVTLSPGAIAQPVSAYLDVVHNGVNTPVRIDLSGTLVEVVNSTVIRLNAGGDQISYDGKIFDADQYFTEGKSYTNNQAQVPEMFKSERSASPPQFAYNIPVPDGDYTVNLFFAEVFWGATGGGSGGIGSRVFDVTLEGALILDDYDIFAEVGAEVPVVKSFDVTVTDGQINMFFDASSGAGGTDQPKISAIELLSVENGIPTAVIGASKVSGEAPLSVNFTGSNSEDDDGIVSYLWDFGDGTTSTDINPVHVFNTAGTYSVTLTVTDSRGATDTETISIEVLPSNNNAGFELRINAGGAEALYGSKVFEADQYFIEGRSFTNTDAQVPNLFKTERSSFTEEFNYSIPLVDGSYQVTLYFAEIYWGATGGGVGGAGSRIFDVSLEGELVLDNFDIYAEAGPESVVTRSYSVEISDQSMDLYFSALTADGGVDQPKISAIEIIGIDGGVFQNITVQNISDQFSTPGESISLAVVATGGNPEENFTYSISGQPDGVDIEPTNGLIFGTIEESALNGGPGGNGIHQVEITVSKPGSDPVTELFTWTIAPEDLVWRDKNENENYTARHECSFVQAGDKFYLFGGRESATTMDVYDFQGNTWSSLVNSAPFEFNHFQAVTYEGLIWVVGGFKTNNYPVEENLDHVWVFNPATTQWIQGPEIPEGRKRGGAGTVVYNNKIYLVGGNTNGHDGGFVAFLDVFDPATGSWTTLADAPRARDHFHAAVINGKLYAVAGRQTGGTGGVFGPVLPEVDVYDFQSNTWTTLPADQNIPTPRASASTVTFENKLFVIGGEAESSSISEAYDLTEIYDPVAAAWETGPALNYGRHGTQAIVSGPGIHITAGSPSRGGGNQKNMEYLNLDAPQGNPSNNSELQSVAQVNFNQGETKIFGLDVVNGNLGVWVNSMELQGENAGEFVINTSPVSDRLLSSGSTFNLSVTHVGELPVVSVPLLITYNDDQSLTINLEIGDVPEGDAVVSLTLVNADTDTDLFQLTEGLVVDSELINGMGVNVRANTDPETVGSVVLELSGAQTALRKESVAPYALFGDSGGNYYSGTLTPGDYVVTATPFSESGGTGTPGTPLTINFSVGEVLSGVPPTAIATSDVKSGEAPLEVTFTGSGSTPGDSPIVSYAWDFGDGGSSAEADPVYIFNAPGEFTTTLLITDEQGLTSSAELQISVTAANEANTYYVSPTGDDANPGTDPQAPWQTLSKVNTFTFKEGDTLLLESGQSFNGGIVIDETDGNDPALPLVISTYNGSDKAIIESGDDHGLFVTDRGGIEVRNLIFTGSGLSQNTSFGLLFLNQLSGDQKLNGITITDIEVSGYGESGIAIAGINDTSGFDNVLIERAKVFGCRDRGITSVGYFDQNKLGYSHSNVTVRSCEVYGIPGYDKGEHSGNGIVLSDVQNSSISYCTVYDSGNSNTSCGGPMGIWYYDADQVSISHNEVYGMSAGTGCDGGAFDLDGGVTNGVMQYNYSHDNAGPGFLIGQFESSRPMDNITVRYNISENDAGNNHGAITLFNDNPTGGPDNVKIYNNSVFIGNDTENQGRSAVKAIGSQNSLGTGVNFYNNILSVSGTVVLVDIPVGYEVGFLGNLYNNADGVVINYQGKTYTSVAEFRTSLNEVLDNIDRGTEGDPNFVNAGAGVTIGQGNDLTTLEGYKLLPESPAIEGGINLLTEVNGISDIGDRDYFGNSNLFGNKQDVGAFEFDQIVSSGPVALAEANIVSGTAPLEVGFTGSGSTPGSTPISDYLWEFGDGGSSAEADPIHTYNSAGVFTATLTVTDEQGQSDTDSIDITVNDEPQGDAVVSVTLVNADSDTDMIEITEGLVIDILEVDGIGVNIRANTNPETVGSVVLELSGTQSALRTESVAPYALFGDSGGNYFAGTLAVGDYTLTATPYTGSGGTGTAGTPLTVNFSVGEVIAGVPPTAVATSDINSGEAPLEISFTGSLSTPGDNPIASYVWDFGDGNASNEADPVYTYTASGVYTAELTVTDDQGLTDVATVEIAVTEPPVTGPLAVVSSNLNSGEAPLEVSFSGSGSSPGDNPIVSYSWNFGDGGSATEADPVYTYTAAGVYTAELTVTDDQGLTDKASIEITVTEPPVQGDAVVSFTLINADSDTDIAQITEGQVIDGDAINGVGVNIRANTDPEIVGSVVLELSGSQSNLRTESVAPYALFGDRGGNYFGGNLFPGEYTLKATPYSASGGTGTPGTPLVVNFSVGEIQAKAEPETTIERSELTIKEASQVVVFPNPASEVVHIMGLQEYSNDTDAYFNIYDLKGSLIMRVQARGVFSGNLFDLEVDRLQQGTYILGFERTGDILLRKQIVIKK